MAVSMAGNTTATPQRWEQRHVSCLSSPCLAVSPDTGALQRKLLAPGSTHDCVTVSIPHYVAFSDLADNHSADGTWQGSM